MSKKNNAKNKPEQVKPAILKLELAPEEVSAIVSVISKVNTTVEDAANWLNLQTKIRKQIETQTQK